MRKYKKIVFVIVGAIIALVIFCPLYYNMGLGPVSNDSKLKVIEIKQGSISSIGKYLKENNLIKNEKIFKLYIKLTGKDNLKASTYQLSENMGVRKIVSILEKGNSYNPSEIKITFKEGKNIRTIASLISENTNNSEEDVYSVLKDNDYLNELIDKYWFLTDDIKNSNIYYSLEGYLFPETYAFLNKDVTVKEIIEKMLKETEARLADYKDDIENLSLSIHEFMTLASLVELEGAKANDRSAVAGVFYNRLNDNWSLGSDVTTYYASKIDDYNYSLTYKELDDCSNEYNTRCSSYKGLPVGPIANPGLESIKATLNPEKHNYYYFVADCKGKVYLNTNSSGHTATINKLKSENNWCA